MAVLYNFPFPPEQGQSMNVSDIYWNDEEHIILIGETTVALTQTEYRLLSPLRYGTPLTYTQLVSLAYNYAFDEKIRAMMDKHIDRIRGKLRGSGIYVYCINGYGYVLLPEISSYEALWKNSSREGA